MISQIVRKHTASFRDPSGFIFEKEGEFFRQVNFIYKENYDFFINSGLFDEMVRKKYIVGHTEIDSDKSEKNVYKILKPEQIPFISYPYEWSFGALKDAALLTLEIQQLALKYDMSLKDASAYNIQFFNGAPILIDTLSLEKYPQNQPWVAYRQFCQHFLAPLALMSLTDLRLSSLLKIHLDGIPLDLTAKLLPGFARLNLGLLTHIFLHARSQKTHADDAGKKATPTLPKNQLLGIIDNLKSTIHGLKLPEGKTTWSDYYDKTNYFKKSFKHKESIVASWIDRIKPKTIWDAGANNGHFSRLGTKRKILTVASDFDPIAVELAYRQMKRDSDPYLLPLLIDLTNPSPAIGWDNTERDSFLSRCRFDLTLNLALIHHLAIANNLPLSLIAKMMNDHTKYAIIEFVPKEDSNTQRLLANRKNIFADYDEKTFEKEFSHFFETIEKVRIIETNRTLYLFKKKL